MSFTGVIVNTFTVLIGSLLGLLLKRGIPERVSSAVMTGIGLCTVLIGISGALEGQNILIAIASMVFGSILGTLIDIDDKINRLGLWVEKKFQSRGGGDGKVSVAQGFVTASLLFCIGAMTINGSLNAGISGDNSLLFTKATLDFFSSFMLSASLGIGVLFAAAFVFGFQGLIVLLAGFLAPFLTGAAIAEMNCAGSLIILAIGTNLLNVTEIKVANYLPAIVLAPVFVGIVSLF